MTTCSVYLFSDGVNNDPMSLSLPFPSDVYSALKGWSSTDGQRKYSIVVTGVLELWQNDRVGVYVENTSEAVLTIRDSSSFMGHCVGS